MPVFQDRVIIVTPRGFGRHRAGLVPGACAAGAPSGAGSPQCASKIVKAMERPKRLVIMTPRGRFGRWAKLLARGWWTGWR